MQSGFFIASWSFVSFATTTGAETKLLQVNKVQPWQSPFEASVPPHLVEIKSNSIQPDRQKGSVISY